MINGASARGSFVRVVNCDPVQFHETSGTRSSSERQFALPSPWFCEERTVNTKMHWRFKWGEYPMSHAITVSACLKPMNPYKRSVVGRKSSFFERKWLGKWI